MLNHSDQLPNPAFKRDCRKARQPLNFTLACKDNNGNSKGTNVIIAHPTFRKSISVIKWVSLTALVLFGAVIILGIGGYQIPFWPSDKEVSLEEPFSNFIGRELFVIGEVSALAWNDFPDKEKILVVSLTSPPGASNRFVSNRTHLQQGQRIFIQSAWRSFSLIEFTYYYQVSVPGAGLPEGVPIQLDIGSDGVPDPLVYKFEQLTSHFSGLEEARRR